MVFIKASFQYLQDFQQCVPHVIHILNLFCFRISTGISLQFKLHVRRKPVEHLKKQSRNLPGFTGKQLSSLVFLPDLPADFFRIFKMANPHIINNFYFQFQRIVISDFIRIVSSQHFFPRFIICPVNSLESMMGPPEIQLHIHIRKHFIHHDAQLLRFSQQRFFSLRRGQNQIIHTLGMVHCHRKTVLVAIQLKLQQRSDKCLLSILFPKRKQYYQISHILLKPQMILLYMLLYLFLFAGSLQKAAEKIILSNFIILIGQGFHPFLFCVQLLIGFFDIFKAIYMVGLLHSEPLCQDADRPVCQPRKKIRSRERKQQKAAAA